MQGKSASKVAAEPSHLVLLLKSARTAYSNIVMIIFLLVADVEIFQEI